MVVVSAFGTLAGTQNAGMVAYYRAPGCDKVTIADVLPILSKINYYEDEYVIGEMLIWDAPTLFYEPNNCTKVRVIIYNDGWICAWFDKTTQNQLGASGLTYVNSTTLSGWGSSILYPNELNGMMLKITDSDSDPECPVGTIFTIRNADNSTSQIQIHQNSGGSTYHFNSGYTYSVDIYMSNGHLIWYGFNTNTHGNPPTNSNRLYRAIVLIWDQIKYSTNSSNYTNGNATKVFMYDSQTAVYTDETTDFNDVDVSDCQVFPTDEVVNDEFYIGRNYKFNGISITMGTVGVGSGVAWEYYNGSAWTGLTAVDGTSGFTSTGELTFNPPDDWSKVFVNGSNYYWIRARVTTASYTTTPLITQGQLYIQNSITFIDTELGLYNYEYPSANYILLIGRYGSSGYEHTYLYNTLLPGKTLYNIDYNIGIQLYLYNVEINNYNIFQAYNYTNGHIIRNGISIAAPSGIQNVIDMDQRVDAYQFTVGVILISS